MVTENLLLKCGLNTTEANVLIYLLENGDVGGGALARRTEIKRTTVYTALARLESLGIVGRRRFGSSTRYSVITPQKLPALLRNMARVKYEEVENATSLLAESLEEFPKRKKHNLGGFEITTVESVRGVYQVLERALLQGGYCGLFNPQVALIGPLKKVAVEFLKKSAFEKPHIREIVIAGPLAKWWKTQIKNSNHSVKEINAAGVTEEIVTDILLFDKTVVLNNYATNNERSVLIHDADYFNFMMLMFNQLWEKLP